jgi:hypothetical protein
MPFDNAPTTYEPWQVHLLSAARIVRERWMQGETGENGGPRCALGALLEVSHCGSSVRQSRNRLERYLGRYITDWNDELGRTAEEVATAMEMCALQYVPTARRG